MKKSTLAVWLNDKLVGRLEKTSAGLQFIYDAQWLITPNARPISLSLPLVATPFSGEVVYHFFDNLLPDNAQIRSRIQTHFHIKNDHPFELLKIIGKECVGAIQILEPGITNSDHKTQYALLSDKKIAEVLCNTQHNPLGMSEDAGYFRISIAGVQEKTALLLWRKKWCRPIGSTPTTHIFKLPIGYISHQHIDLSDSCENEWLCAQIASTFKIPVAECDIATFEKVKTLIVKRFDRKLSSDKKRMVRLPQEDMCQALGVSSYLKYQADGGPGIKNIMQLLVGSENSVEDRDIFFRSQVLFWLLAAIDGHAKNFSILIQPGGSYRLAPLYDILSAYPLMARNQLQAQKIKMAMALEDKNKHYHWHDMRRRYFLSTAQTAKYPVERAEKILDEMLHDVDHVIQTVSRGLPAKFPRHISQPIFEGMLKAKNKLLR